MELDFHLVLFILLYLKLFRKWKNFLFFISVKFLIKISSIFRTYPLKI